MTAAEFIALKNAQIASLATKGRPWLKQRGLELRAALERQRLEGRKDGTVASIVGQLEDLRAAWKLTAA